MKTPGVTIDEGPLGPPPIEGVSTSTAGMTGVTERGPEAPQLITSWREYQDVFGGFVDGGFLPAAVKGFFDNGGRRVYVARASDARTGLAALEPIDEIAILLAPDEVTDNSGTTTDAVIDHCERLRDRFAIVSAPANRDRIQDLRPPRDSAFAAFYYPWVRVLDPVRQRTVLVPPGGHVAGIYARTDIDHGVHKAPANEDVRGLTAGKAGSSDAPLEFTVTKDAQDILNPRGVNVIRDFRDGGRGVRLWGARTMSSDSEWKYVNVRRLFVFVEQSIHNGMQWVVFEPNSENTWANVRRVVTDFLFRLWRDGALLGTTPEEAYFVKCDRTTMTQNDLDNGRLVCLIGMAPVKPAEFVIFRIAQRTVDATAHV
jgi:Bacteriophage tail sheath protein